jgi:hypothetical protein
MTVATAFSQDNNTIKFLGIPVDGNKKEMISKLQEKGYEYDTDSGVLFGEFNGTNVVISVQTVNNRVWRIAIVDAGVNSDEANIKIRFNRLFEQLSNNDKYEVADGNKLGEKEDISYEMTVHNKRYEASFTFKDKSIHGLVWYMIAQQYGKYGIVMFYENLDNAANGDDL